MYNIQAGAERMQHDRCHLSFIDVKIGSLITISTPPVLAGKSLEMKAIGALHLYKS